MKSLKRNWRRKLISSVMAVSLFYAVPLQAQNVVGLSEIITTSNWQQWQTVGEAQLTWFVFDIYKSRLKAPDGQYSVSRDVSPHPFALEINYQRDISKEQLLDVTDEQWQKLGFTEPYRQKWILELDTMFPNIKKGDELTYLTDGKNGQLIYRKAGSEPYKTVGYVKDERLNDAFLSIWLSPKTEFPKLRKQLIGQVR
ncbi:MULTISPECIES: chalcone isomerase family protein [unclassified Vibrio]|uniref:chalcone isomerase family protein n=1 Tax=Vibrio TaxID=662 RepID=UPI002074F6B9|nr:MULTISPECIES: chalcone isomerase family protein [unclassified Vibrio]MDK9776390.1 chalcone isomerase family protein [Vibrio sp. D401a]MDK9800992.1 chalcone isomerase family protein [Vibrio sp. D406a]USD49025.1 chalcone isomerase family protein [Vibrio sp. SCSIO 43153]